MPGTYARLDGRRPGWGGGPAVFGRSLWDVIDLDAATVMIQWAAGGLFFLWITTRRREEVFLEHRFAYTWLCELRMKHSEWLQHRGMGG